MGQSQMKQTKGSFYSCGLLLIGAKELLNYHPDVQGKNKQTKNPANRLNSIKPFSTHTHLNRIN